MSTIIPYFDPLLGKLRNSDVALISLATLVVSDPLIVNNLIVNSNASINNLTASTIIASTATIGTAHISNIEWNLTSGATVVQEGQMTWDSVQQTTVLGMAGGNVNVALGMETLFPRRVRNSTGSTMAKGTVVYINGVSGNTPTVDRAIATSDSTSAFTLGMTAENINDGSTGWVTTFGELTGINLSSFTGGDTLYLSGATAGAFTNIPQSAPIHYVRVGTVVKATADGALVVNVLNGYELQELHNVVISSLASGQILQSGVSSLWYNRSLASAVNDFIVFPTLPSLGSLAVMNQLSYASILNTPSLGSLAPLNSVTQEYLPSTASFTNLYTTDISTGGLAVTSTASIRTARITNLGVSTVSVTSAINTPNLFGLNFLGVTSLISTDTLSATNAVISTATVGTIYADTYLNLPAVSYTSLTNLPSLGSLAVMNQLSFTSLINQPSLGSLAYGNNVVSPLVLSGVTLSISQASIVHDNLGGLTTGDPHTQYALLAGRVGGQNLIGGTGNNEILFFQANTALSNTATNDAFRWRAGQNGGNTRMILRHDGALGVNNTSPVAGLHVTTGLTAVAGYEKGLQVNLNINKTTGDAIGAFFEVSDVAGGVKTIYGHRARIYYSGSTTISGVQATSNQVYVDGGGTVNAVEVLTSNLDVTTNSTVVDARLIRLFAPAVNTGGSIGTLTGLAIPNLTQGTTNYSIYSEGGNMYHAGKIGIGTTTNTGSNSIRIDSSDVTFNRIAINNASTAVAGWGGYTFTVNDAFSGGYYRNQVTADLGIWTQGLGSSPRVVFYNNGRVGVAVVSGASAQVHIDQSSSTANIPVISLDQADSGEPFINYIGASSASSNLSIWGNTTVGTLNMKVRVSVNGIDRWMYLYTN
jgi:hypothetical protein